MNEDAWWVAARKAAEQRHKFAESQADARGSARPGAVRGGLADSGTSPAQGVRRDEHGKRGK